MKYWSYNEPIWADDGSGDIIGNEVVTYSETAILAQYWDYWCDQMRKAGKDLSNYCYQDCIDDWVIINWAWESN